ncbi:hypothetical protein vB_AbaP_Acibel007_25 [Acinetobacter phage vB_AbaP_Acibel007]|uniref:Uncharacterized protein n=1 Tax=Acinetobacter phage vB_AbaP_Acibel007 TaxID=1481187 RepID=A0A075DXY5_9CAUD|nr:hypothetical protein vB_AbaP_Acibel007_25 [Acinetobacter phage vB_AbaP_Acibel007]AHY26796.1 hypothetical protein vB_AbaP_Acibel007_25 [Acinetobacter phage vB_AbaP_Acibel007]
MTDTKRATGRTTRMIFKVGEFLAANPDETATIIIHSQSWGWMRNMVNSLLSSDMSTRITIKSYSTWSSSGIGKRPDYFFDHHCFYDQYLRAKATLEYVEQEYTKYDV